MDASTWLRYKRSKVVAVGQPKVGGSTTSEIVTDTRFSTQELIFENEVKEDCCGETVVNLNNPAMILKFNVFPTTIFSTRAIPVIELPVTFLSPIRVDWGDGITEIFAAPPVRHTYTTFGSYDMEILGPLMTFGSTTGWPGSKLLDTVISWGDYPPDNLRGAFYGAFRLVSVPTIPPNVTNTSYMFYGATAFDKNLSDWDVSIVTDMSYMFYEASSFTAAGLSSWTPFAATNMNYMFYKTTAAYTLGLFNTDLSRWPSTTSYTYFLSSDGINDTTIADPNSPYETPPLIMSFNTPQGISTTSNTTGKIWTNSTVISAGSILNVLMIGQGGGGASGANPEDLPPNGNSQAGCGACYKFSYTLKSNAAIGSIVLTRGDIRGKGNYNLEPDQEAPNSYGQDGESTFIIFRDNGVQYSFYAQGGGGAWNQGPNYSGISNPPPPPAPSNPGVTYTINSAGNTNQIRNGYQVGGGTDPTLFSYGLGGSDGSAVGSPGYWTLDITPGPLFVTLPVTGNGILVEYGDGSLVPNLSGIITGNGDINIYGTVSSFGNVSGWTGASFVKSVTSWGTSPIVSLAGAFKDVLARGSVTSVPSLPPSVRNTASMFEGTTFSGDISGWIVNNVSDMSNMFFGATDFAARGLSLWNPASATNMNGMFRGTTAAYTNGVFSTNLRSWPNAASRTRFFSPDSTTDTSLYDGNSPFAVLASTLTFAGTPTITLPITGLVTVDYGNGIPVSSLTGTVSGPVKIYGNFTRFGSSGWAGVSFITGVSSWPATVTNLSYAFAGATRLTTVPNIPATVTNTSHMFNGAIIFNQDISTWNMSNVTDMSHMFASAISFTATGLSAWTPTAATNMDGMFRGTTAAYSDGFFTTNLRSWPTTASRIFMFSPDGITDTTASDPNSSFSVLSSTLTFTGTPTITLPITGSVTVDYGNGTRVFSLSGTVSGPVKIYGNFTSFGSSGWTGVTSLLSVSSWPATVTNLSFAFAGATGLTSVSTIPAAVTNTADMFTGATSFNQNISGWNVTNISNMSNMFNGATSFTAIGLSSWNPVAATNMNGLFRGTTAAYANGLFKTNLNGWPRTASNVLFFSPDGTTDTTSVDGFSPFSTPSMILDFSGNPTITLPITGSVSVDYGNGTPVSDLSGTVSGSGTVRIYGPFTGFGATEWRGVRSLLRVSSWPSSLINLSNAFYTANLLTSVPSTLPSSVTSLESTFHSAAAFNQDLSGWNVTNVTTMEGMFMRASSFNRNLSGWNVSNVVQMGYMFFEATSYEATGLDQWNVANVTRMDNMFNKTSAAYTNTTSSGLFRTYLSDWPKTATNIRFFSPDGITDTTQTDPRSPFSVPTMVLTFTGTPTITLPITGGSVLVNYGNRNISSSLTGTVTGGLVKIYGPFTGFGSNGWIDVSSVLSISSWPSTLTTLSYAFAGATRLTSVPSVIPPSVTNTSYMFNGATSFNQDLSGWDVSNITDMSYMFAYASSYTAFDISRWNAVAATSMDGMFRGTTAAYTDGVFTTDIITWPKTASRVFFFSSDGITDTTLTDPKSPFNPANAPSIALAFSGNPTITLPITGGTVTVDYGNRIRVSSLTGTVTGPVNVYGVFSSFGADGWAGVGSLLRVSAWRAQTSFAYAFKGATQLTSVPSLPASVTNTSFMFQGATAFNQDISGWNVSNVLNMASMFQGATAFTARNLNIWTPTAATTVSGMFRGTTAAYLYESFATNLSGWPSSAISTFFFSPDGITDTTQADVRSPFAGPSMVLEFSGTPTITLPITGGTVAVDFGAGRGSSLTGTVSGPVRVYGLFSGFGSDGWAGVGSLLRVTSLSGPTNLSYAFKGATQLTSVPTIGGSVTNTSFMFQGATAFNQNISDWNVSNVLNMTSMFQGATSFTATDLSLWTPTACTAMNNMFQGTSAAYTNTTAAGTFLTNLGNWPATASSTLFFSPNGTTDTTLTDSRSPFIIPTMVLDFSGNPTITLPITGGSVLINYGAGRVSGLSGIVTGPVRIYGSFTGFGADGWAGVGSLLRVSSWPALTNLSYAFKGATRLTSVPTVGPSVINTSFMFQGATAFNQNISAWNVANVTNMAYMFQGATAFNQAISTWAVSNVVNMTFMFSGATSFNQAISAWNVANVTNMTYMFQGATAFNQNISAWNVSSVENMTYMFQGATAFTATDLSGWTPTACTAMNNMFQGTSAAYTNTTAAGAFLTNLGNWPATATSTLFFSPNGTTDTTLTDSRSPFGIPTMVLEFTGNPTITLPITGGSVLVNYGASRVISLSGTVTGSGSVRVYGPFTGFGSDGWAGVGSLLRVSSWPALTNLSYAFKGATQLTSVPTVGASVTNTSFMLQGATAFNQAISAWNVSNVSTMANMFFGATTFNQPISEWNVEKVVSMTSMFQGASAFDQIISGWNVANVTNMASMFQGAIAFSQAISAWNVAKVVNMTSMFSGATTFPATDLLNWTPTACTAMNNMFQGTSAAYTNTTAAGTFLVNLGNWPATATSTLFFSPNGTTDTTLTDSRSPFANPTMVLDFSGNPTITLPITGGITQVNYGAGRVSSLSGTVTGSGSVRVYGLFTNFGADGWAGVSSLRSVSSWPALTNLSYAFKGATLLTSVPTVGSSVTNTSFMLQGATAFNQPISAWNVSNVSTMENMFSGASTFNQAISAWAVANVTNMTSMFQGATAFNRPISAWNVSNVLNMASMFQGATAFTATDLSGWTPTACTAMNNMFQGTSAAYTNTTAAGTFLVNLGNWPATATSTLFFSPNGTTDTTLTDIRSPFAIPSMVLDFSGNPTITLPITGGSVLVNYGNNRVSNLSGTVTGSVRVYGPFTGFGSDGWAGVTSLRSVSSWPALTNLSYAFKGATLLTSVPTVGSSVTNTSFMLQGATAFNQAISEWNVSNVSTMVNMFFGASTFNQPISGWNVSNVTNMTSMFQGAAAFNQIISAWAVANVTNMTSMFQGAAAFDQNISGWNVAKVVNMTSMFSGATAFPATDLSGWTPTVCTAMNNMFQGTSAAYTNTTASGTFLVNLGNWPATATSTLFFSPNGTTDTTLTDGRSPFAIPTMVLDFSGNPTITLPITGGSVLVNYGASRVISLSGTVTGSGSVRVYGSFTGFGSDGWAGVSSLRSVSSWPALTNLSYAFKGATLLTSVPTVGASVTNTSFMFQGATAFNQAISAWVVSNVTNMASMFQGATAFNQPISGWNVANVTNMASMFQGATAFNQVISAWAVANVTNMASMFQSASAFNQAISGWNVSNVVNMASMFQGATAFNQVISAWAVANVTNMASMFQGATTFNQEISAWTVTNVSSMSNMLNGATAFNKSLSPWIMTNVKNTSFMFNGATAFNQNISGWNVSGITTMANMFAGATSYSATGLTAWTPTACTDMSGMFRGTSASYTGDLFNTNVDNWPSTAASTLFFSYNGTTDTTILDAYSPFAIPMVLNFTGTPTITLPVTGSRILVNFGNGTKVTSLSGTVSGPVRVFGGFTNFGSGTGAPWTGIESLLSVTYWPSTLTNLHSAFRNATSLTSVPSTLPLSVTSLVGTFMGATAFNQNLSGWNVSNVTSMFGMFTDTQAYAGAGLASWNPISCTNMDGMFKTNPSYASALYDLSSSNGIFKVDISDWPSTATNSYFFSPDGGTTDTSQVDFNSPFRIPALALKFTAGAPPPFIFISGTNVIARSGGVSTGIRDQGLQDIVPVGTVKIYGHITYLGRIQSEYLTDIVSWITVPSSSTTSSFTSPTLQATCLQCIRLTSVPRLLPPSVTSLNGTFGGCTIFNSDISDWNTTNVTIMNSMFSNARAFNSDISRWNTTNVGDMSNMFQEAISFNANLSAWNVYNVSIMSTMFRNARSFTAAGLSAWRPRILAGLGNTYGLAAFLNGASAAYTNTTSSGRLIENLNTWKLSLPATHVSTYRVDTFLAPDGITDTTLIDPNSPVAAPTLVLTFTGTPTITLPITGGTVFVNYGNGVFSSSLTGTVSGTVTIYGSFTGFGSPGWAGVTSLTSVTSWSDMTSLANAFNGATSLTTVPATLPSSVRNMDGMFQGATAFNQNLSGWNVTSVTSMNNMFRGTSASYSNTTSTGLFNSNLSVWRSTLSPTFFFSPNGTTDTTTTDPRSPFGPGTMVLNFTPNTSVGLPISGNIGTVEIDYGNGIKTSNVNGTTSGQIRVFGDFTSFGYGGPWTGVGSLLSVTQWPSSLTSLIGAFYNATSLTSVPSTFPPLVTDMSQMFRGTTSFNQNISGWNVSSVTTSMQSMFQDATAFNQNIGAWNVSNVINMRYIFVGATSFTAAGLNQWTPNAATLMDNMFDGTSAAYTNTTSSGLFLTDLRSWPKTASRTFFFSPDKITNTTFTDPKSPFFGLT